MTSASPPAEKMPPGLRKALGAWFWKSQLSQVQRERLSSLREAEPLVRPPEDIETALAIEKRDRKDCSNAQRGIHNLQKTEGERNFREELQGRIESASIATLTSPIEILQTALEERPEALALKKYAVYRSPPVSAVRKAGRAKEYANAIRTLRRAARDNVCAETVHAAERTLIDLNEQIKQCCASSAIPNCSSEALYSDAFRTSYEDAGIPYVPEFVSFCDGFGRKGNAARNAFTATVLSRHDRYKAAANWGNTQQSKTFAAKLDRWRERCPKEWRKASTNVRTLGKMDMHAWHDARHPFARVDLDHDPGPHQTERKREVGSNISDLQNRKNRAEERDIADACAIGIFDEVAYHLALTERKYRMELTDAAYRVCLKYAGLPYALQSGEPRAFKTATARVLGDTSPKSLQKMRAFCEECWLSLPASIRVFIEHDTSVGAGIDYLGDKTYTFDDSAAPKGDLYPQLWPDQALHPTYHSKNVEWHLSFDGSPYWIDREDTNKPRYAREHR